MKIFCLETFQTPPYPEFKAGETYHVDEKLGRTFIERGLAKEFDGSKEQLKELRDYPRGKTVDPTMEEEVPTSRKKRT